MAQSIKAILTDSGVLAQVILSPELDLLLSALEVTGPPQPDPADPAGILTGDVHLAPELSRSPVPGFDFALTLPTGVVAPAPYKLRLDPPAAPTSFQFWLVLAGQGQALLAFRFLGGIPGLALTGAARTVAADGRVSLTALPADDPRHVPVLVSRSPEAGAALGPALLVSGSASEAASLRFTPDTDSTRGMVALGLEPSAVVFGTSKIGFDCPAVIIDDSEDASAEGQGAPTLDPPLAAIGADLPAWRGLLARQLDFYLPPEVPLFGGHPIRGYFEVALGAGGAELVIESRVPARAGIPGQAGQPGYSVRIECLDPAARGLSGLVPTLISATAELPLDGARAGFSGGEGNHDITFGAGKPLRVTATFTRDPVNAPGSFRLTLGVTAQGQDGLLSVSSAAMGGAKIFNTAAALATALIADRDIARTAAVGDTAGVVLSGLLAAGAALSSLFTDDSRFVLHGAEIESTGHGAPLGGPVSLTLDYSVAVRVTQIKAGVLAVSMNPDQPMRIRVRRARLSVDPGKSGLEMIGLDFDQARMEIENPGAWNVKGLDSLFDVLGSRSGRGSSWLEVDLRFKLNLGPIQVSGATIRATLKDDGSIEASVRGLKAGLTLPGAIEGSGQLQLLDQGFAADLRAKLLALNVAADAGIIYAPPMIVLRLGVDLPAPIPLANSGFGLFGLGGLFGLAAEPDYGAEADPDPVLRQLKWTPEGAASFRAAPGQSTFGLLAAVGTLPDFGFSFSAKAGVLISVPDVAVRGALNGRVLQPAVKISDPGYPPSAGISFLGFIGVDQQALSFGLLGQVDLRPLLKVKVPLAGHFPFKHGAEDWYVYLGADGAPTQGRSIGPISACVLPDILKVGADAYIMLRGKGIEGWPSGRALPSGPLTLPDGFVVAFGFSLQNTFGIEPIVWAELYASLDLLIGAKPPTLAGFGRAGGSLNLGPFSLGVQAQVAFMLSEAQSYFWAEVTGRIELFFFDIEGTVTLSFGGKPELTLPDPDLHPLDRLGPAGTRVGSLGTLTDDSYRVVSRLVEDPAAITDELLVWPDTIVSLPFAIAPEINRPAALSQFPGVGGPGALPPAARVGSELLRYTWRLDRLELFDVTDEADPLKGAGVRPAGQLAAAWQVPRSGGGGSSDVSELLLFSHSSDLWINRLADGGEGLSGQPLQQAADLCHRVVGATPGWATGFQAGQDRPGFRLPPEPVSQNPLVSRVEARLHHFGLTARGTAVPLDQVFSLPPPFSLEAARLVAWPAPQEIKHPFAGYLVAPDLRWLAGLDLRELLQGEAAFAGQQITLELSEPVVGGLLVLVADRELFGIQENLIGLRVFDDGGQSWFPPELFALPGGETAGLFQAPSAAPVSRVTVTFPLGRPLGVAGLGGTTVGARDAATAENAAIADGSARQAAAAAAGPRTDPAANVPHQRAILEPGRLYRIDLDLVWSGQMFQQNEAGQVVPVPGAAKTDVALYTPKGSDTRVPTQRQLFFRTAPKPPAPPAPPAVDYGHPEFLTWLRLKQDVFHPEMIGRYLAGYDPAQSEEFRFCDDPLRAHFLQDHVAALAGAYGFGLKVAVRRVDRPGPAHASPLLLDPDWTFASDPRFLGEVDQLRWGYAQASTCAAPIPGATATVQLALDPQAWYDLHVLAEATDPAFENGRLPGVTFRTSRWRTPADLFAGLGFTVQGGPAPAAVLLGDLPLSSPPALDPAVTEGDDQAFQNALRTLGLDGWPLAEAPRLSRVWVPDAAAGWLFAGLLAESPEPVHRPGRLDLAGLTLEMGAAGKAVRFDLRRRDRSGSRLLYLTATPFRVVTRGRLGVEGGPFPRPPLGHLPRFRTLTPQLVLTATATPLLGPATTLGGTLTLPTAPDFWEDP